MILLDPVDVFFLVTISALVGGIAGVVLGAWAERRQHEPLTRTVLERALPPNVLMHAVNRETVGFVGGAAVDGDEIRRRLVDGMLHELELEQ